jgi:hypothetical protein
MDETRVRGLLQRAAAGEEPPSRVDVELARSRGRSKLRWRRAATAGASAAAVVAVLVAAVATSGSGGTAGRGRAPETHGPVTAPSRFNPVRPYATFGWLPGRESLVAGRSAQRFLDLTAGTGPAWQLSVYAAGFCNLTSGQVLRQLKQGQQPQLDCSKSAGGALYQVANAAAARVGGHAAFWTANQTYLIWQYANGGWAALTSPTGAAARMAVKVAGRVRYGDAGPPVKFAVQSLGMPGGWTVLFVSFAADAGVLRAYQYVIIGTGAVARSAIITTGPSSGPDSCYTDRQSTRQTINGYQVIVRQLAAPGTPADQLVCAPDIDGLTVMVSTSGSHASPDAVSIFRRHLRILGTNPADWTTEPLG